MFARCISGLVVFGLVSPLAHASVSPGNDWVEPGLREAYVAARHAARPRAGGGFEVDNPGQGWRTEFDGRGFTAASRDEAWTWGLELVSYGFEEERCEVAGSAVAMQARGQRVFYDWDEFVQEWFVNDSRGLEHGFTVHERPLAAAEPRGGAGRLIFELAVRGSLTPESSSSGRSARFLDADGTAVVTYSGLTVFDGTGSVLPSRLTVEGARISLEVDESGAVYPLTIDPLAQRAYLKASNTEELDLFGGAVAVSGNTAVIGASGEDSAATGVNGNQADNSRVASGAAYVFVRSGSSWSQEAYLKAHNTDAVDRFGASVAISGDTIAIGATGESSNSTTINSGAGDDSADDAGAVYIFFRDGSSWSQQAYLKAFNTDPGDHFGTAVAISGNTVVVGAPAESSAGHPADNSAGVSGAAYVFVRNGTSWSLEAYLKASDFLQPFFIGGDQFGSSVAVAGDTAVIGAPNEDSAATGVNGDEGDNSASNSGAAYVFVRSGTSWSQEAYLKASNTDDGDLFYKVAIDGDTIAVGARGEAGASPGVNGDESDDSLPGAGAVYVFVRDGGVWSQEAYLKASNPQEAAGFGGSLALAGDSLAVGASREDGGATGVNGDPADQSKGDSGAAYVFARGAEGWRQQAYLKSSNPGFNDFFGSVAISGDTVVVGAGGEDSAATGVDGDSSDDSAASAGAAYVFERLCPSLVTFAEDVRVGTPPNPSALLPGQTYGPQIASTWDPVIDHGTFATDAVADFLLITGGPLNLPFGPSTLLCDPGQGPVLLLANGGAPGAPFAIPIPATCSVVGATLCAQGGSVLPDLSYVLANALDIRVGTY